ncbi:MAG: RNase adapter RapZ [Geminicoccaceae bacterium]|nr:MAG: RNase adapter RapZ [Geminicoccaceae bacterium]
MASVVIVTGLAGAGRGTALGALEDCGFEGVDNLPVGLIRTVVEARERDPQPLAIGIDGRSRHFHAETVEALLLELRADAAIDLQVIFLDCDDDVLVQRFSETRRRHPLADRPVTDAIAREREVMRGIRRIADMHIDTSRFSVHDLRRCVMQRFALPAAEGLRVELVSFSYKVGVPREADLVFDVRFLSNPHWQLELRPLTGLDPEVQAFIRQDERFKPFTDKLLALLDYLLPAYRDEGKSYLTVAFGCTGGKHRSVYLAETVARHLSGAGWNVGLRHREQGIIKAVPPDASPPARQLETAS